MTQDLEWVEIANKNYRTRCASSRLPPSVMNRLLAPITLAARSENMRQLGFVASGNDASLLQPGRYHLKLLLRTGSDRAMHPAEQWQVEISENEARQLQHWYELGVSNSLMRVKP